jgi:hypothetical protein
LSDIFLISLTHSQGLLSYFKDFVNYFQKNLIIFCDTPNWLAGRQAAGTCTTPQNLKSISLRTDIYTSRLIKSKSGERQAPATAFAARRERGFKVGFQTLDRMDAWLVRIDGVRGACGREHVGMGRVYHAR